MTTGERAQQLAASVQEQVAALHENLRRAHAILEQARGDATAMGEGAGGLEGRPA